MPNILKFDDMEVVSFTIGNSDTSLLSNWKILANDAITPIAMMTAFGERTFPSVTHYMQYMRDPGNMDLLNKIIATDEAGKFKTTAQEARKIGIEHWNTVPEAQREMLKPKVNDLLHVAMKAKLDQHPEAMGFALRSTGNAVIVRDSSKEIANNGSNPTYSGYSNQDLSQAGNFSGRELMKLRNEMYQAEMKAHEAHILELDKKITPLIKPDADTVAPELIKIQDDIKALKAKLAAVKALVVENVDEYSEKLRELWKTKFAGSTLANNTTLPHKETTAPDAATQKKFDELAALQFPQPKPAPAATSTSKLTAKPKDVTTQRLGAFNEEKNINVILQALQTKWPDADWKQTATDASGTTLGNKTDQSFKVGKDSISTTKDDVETFKAMLVGFKAAFPTETPRITIEDPKLKAAWEKAITETNIKSEIVVASAKTPKPDPANEERPAPRMGR